MNSETVVTLNNKAVAYLQEGNYCAAVYDLETSLERLYHHKTCWDRYHPQSHYDAGALRVISVPIAPSPCTEEESSNVFEFYRRAFRITSSLWQHDRIHPVSSMIVAKFNMAICYHDDGMRRNRNSHLQLALNLYEEILQMMKQYHIRGHMLLLMAIGNNMGHIHSHLLNFEQTREALCWVRQLAIASRQHASLIPHDDYTFFYKTLLVFHGNDLNVAPAA